MNLLARSSVTGAIAGVAVFGAVFTWQYFQLLAHQPGVATDNRVTSYPPSAAWITAAPCALAAFIVVAAGFFLIGKMRRKTPNQLRVPANGNAS